MDIKETFIFIAEPFVQVSVNMTNSCGEGTTLATLNYGKISLFIIHYPAAAIILVWPTESINGNTVKNNTTKVVANGKNDQAIHHRIIMKHGFFCSNSNFRWMFGSYNSWRLLGLLFLCSY